VQLFLPPHSVSPHVLSQDAGHIDLESVSPPKIFAICSSCKIVITSFFSSSFLFGLGLLFSMKGF